MAEIIPFRPRTHNPRGTPPALPVRWSSAGRKGPRLDGSSGTLSGGYRTDQFLFAAGLDRTDSGNAIGDVTVGDDKIFVGEAISSAVGPLGPRDTAKSDIVGVAADAAGGVAFDPVVGFIFFDRDGNGGAAPIQFTTVTLHLDLHGSDFLVAVLLVE